MQAGVVRWTGNLIQTIGNGTYKIFYAVARDRRNGVKFQFVQLAKTAKIFQAHGISCRVQLGSHDDHWLFDEGRAEGFELTVDDFKRMDRIAGVGITSINQMDKEPRAFHMPKETDAEPRSQVCAFDEARK